MLVCNELTKPWASHTLASIAASLRYIILCCVQALAPAYTLLLQTLCRLAESMPALYVTGEESLQQVAMRAQRLGLPTDKLNMLTETDIESIIAAATGIGATLLLGVDAGPELGGSVTIKEVIGYFGLATAAALAFRVVAGVVRDGET